MRESLLLFLFATIINGGSACGVLGDWEQLNLKVKSSQSPLIAKQIVEKWSERPFKLFREISEDLWKEIIPLLTIKDIESINGQEFDQSPLACRAFAEHLQKFPSPDNFPRAFRLAVYERLAEINYEMLVDGGFNVDENMDWFKGDDGPRVFSLLSLLDGLETRQDTNNIIKVDKSLEPIIDTSKTTKKDWWWLFGGMVKSIPAKWVETDGPVIMQLLSSLTPPRLGGANDDTLTALLENLGNSCNFITEEAIKSLTSQKLYRITPKCIAAIDGLFGMDLSSVVNFFPENAFAAYNGPLSMGTIRRLTGGHLSNYGSLIEDSTLICGSLDLHYFKPFLLSFVQARCLFGYLSKNRGKKLGRSWQYISQSIMDKFTPEMRASWANIHPQDFEWMTESLQSHFFNDPSACSVLLVSKISKTVAKQLSTECLNLILTSSGTPVKLGKLWRYIPSYIIESFIHGKFLGLKWVAVSDFRHMSQLILKTIIDSEKALKNLPQPIEKILIPEDLQMSSTTPAWKFAVIARAAPNLAGQLLVNSQKLNSDIFSHCSGSLLRTLTFIFPDKPRLDWSALLFRLENDQEKFGQIVKSISMSTPDEHLCTTIKSSKEYFKLGWLIRNMSDECREKLSFNLRDISLIRKAPEIAPENLPWQEMLEKYGPSDWKVVSKNKHFAKVIGGLCEFWSKLEGNFGSILGAIDQESLLGSIQPRCIHGLANVLREYHWLVSLLPHNAFSTHQLDQIPCPLKFLSIQQIQHLSEDKEGSTLVVGEEYFDSLKALDLEKLTAFLNLKRISTPTLLKMSIFKDHFDHTIAKIKKGLTGDDEKQQQHQQQQQHQEKLFNRLGIILELASSVEQLEVDMTYFKEKLAGIIPLVLDSQFSQSLIDLINKFSFLKQLNITLVRDAESFRDHLLEQVKGMNQQRKQMKIPFDRQVGFDRKSFIEFLYSSPETFASPGAYIFGSEVVDNGGVTRMLISQGLDDIERDIMVPLLETSSTFSLMTLNF